MVKKMLMGGMVSTMMEELSPDIPVEKEHIIENEVATKMQSLLGDNWALLPVTGSYMMVLVLAMNFILRPMGITPVAVADKAITLAREHELDSKFNRLMISARESAKSGGEFTSEKFKELSDYAEEKGISAKVRELVDDGKQLGKSAFSKGKSVGQGMFGFVKDKIDDITGDEEAEQVEEAKQLEDTEDKAA